MALLTDAVEPVQPKRPQAVRGLTVPATLKRVVRKKKK